MNAEAPSPVLAEGCQDHAENLSPQRCFMERMEDAVQHAFDRFCSTHDTEHVYVKKLLKPDRRPNSKSDLWLNLSPFAFPRLCDKLGDLCDSLKADLCDIFDDCRVDEGSRLLFNLNRAKTFSVGIREALCPVKPTPGSGAVLLYVHDRNGTGLANYRTKLIAEHVLSILLANGYKVYCSSDLISEISTSRYPSQVEGFECTACDFNDAVSEWAGKCEKSQYRQVVNRKDSRASDTVTVIDAIAYLESRTAGRTYSRVAKDICIQRNEFTDCFKESALLNHILNTHVGTVNLIIHVVPLRRQDIAQQAGLLLEILGECTLDQLFLTNQEVTLKTSSDLSVEQYIQGIRKGVEDSLLQRYGTNILDDEAWSSMLTMVTNTVVKFEFLLTGFSSPLHIDSHSSSTCFQDKGGSFLQYNCARVSSIFRRYDEGVLKGMYEPLPKLDDVDFSLLKHKDEWNMLFNYVLPFPKIVKELGLEICKGTSVTISIATQKICRLLVSLSRDLSLYYTKSRVLVEPRKKLLPRMNARLYLLKSIFAVMENGLALLNLLPVERM